MALYPRPNPKGMATKKIALVAVAALTLTLSACGNSDTESADSTTAAQKTAAQEGSPTDAEAEAWVREQYGLSADESWMNAGGNASYITGVRMDGKNLYVTMQIDRATEEDKAESVTKLLTNSASMHPNDFTEQMSWVIVEDGAGTVVKQESV